MYTKYPMSDKIKVAVYLDKELDDFLEKNLTANTQNYVRDLQIRFVSGASHWVQQECPDEVNELIQGFVTSTEQIAEVD